VANGLNPTPDILTVKKLKKVIVEDGCDGMTKAPLHGAIWSRMGSPNYWSLRNMTPTQFYEGEKSGLSALHNFIPTSKNLTTKGKLSMGSDKVLEYTKDEPSKSLRFTTKSQVSSAMFRRMAAMLRNPVPSSNGFVPQEERGAYIEYVTWLHYLLYETSIGGVVELDKMLMQARQDGEWLKFGPIPQRFERTKWPSANPIVCAFCEAAGHPFDQCQYRESEQDIPRLALHASNFVSDSSGKAQICGPWNSTRGCSKGSNCPQQHICLLCKTSTHPAKDCRALAGAGATPPHPKPSKPISPEETKILISFLASLQENREDKEEVGAAEIEAAENPEAEDADVAAGAEARAANSKKPKRLTSAEKDPKPKSNVPSRGGTQ